MMMNFEFQTLRELKRIFDNPGERVAAYRRWRWALILVATGLMFVGFAISPVASMREFLGLVAVLGAGTALGLSVLYSLSEKQTPFIVRYGTLDDEAVKKRLDELKS